MLKMRFFRSSSVFQETIQQAWPTYCNTNKYCMALNFCGTYFLRVFSWSAKKNVPQKIIASTIFSAKFASLVKFYLQTSQVEPYCCHLFKTFLSHRNKTMKRETKLSEKRKKDLRESRDLLKVLRSTEKSIRSISPKSTMYFVIEWHWLLDNCVFHLYMLFHM